MDFSLLIILAIAAAAMFFMTSRTRKQQKAAVNFRSSLAPGQEVMTGSGLFGTVVAVDDEQDIITIESTPGNQSRWLRAAIAKLVEPPADAGAVTGATAATISSADDATHDVIVPDDLSGLSDETDDKRDKRDDGTESK